MAHGNFHRYYTFRPNVVDERLRALQPFCESFTGRRCLDIGCNEGSFTLSIAQNYHVKHMLGMDLDAALVATAAENVRGLVRRCSQLSYILPNTARSLSDYFTTHVEFEVGNILTHDFGGVAFDTVFSFSMSKWVHLNEGDVGLKRLFRIFWELLVHGGTLIFEYQQWQSYKNSRNASAAARSNFDRIQLRPEQFPALLRETGFELRAELNMHSLDVFQRPILILRKPVLGTLGS